MTQYDIKFRFQSTVNRADIKYANKITIKKDECSTEYFVSVLFVDFYPSKTVAMQLTISRNTAVGPEQHQQSNRSVTPP